MQLLSLGLALSLAAAPVGANPTVPEPAGPAPSDLAGETMETTVATEQPAGDQTPGQADAPEATELPDLGDPSDEPVEGPSEPSPAESVDRTDASPTVDPPAPSVEPSPAATPEPIPPTAASPDKGTLGCYGAKPCVRMTIAGIVTGSLGLAAVGTGIGLLVRPDQVIPERPAFVDSTRPAGIVTLTVGVGVTLASVLMLVAARRGYIGKRDKQARAHVEFTGTGLRF